MGKTTKKSPDSENKYPLKCAGNGRSAKIIGWNAYPEDQIATFDGKIFNFKFEKVFPEYPQLGQYDKFFINKDSYKNQLDLICRYINFFEYYYDPEERLPHAYLKLKFEIDKNKTYTEDNMEELISAIHEIIFTPYMIEQITKMVEENYIDDIESDIESGKSKYIKDGEKHLESLEFTNEHNKAMLRISFGQKIIAPVLFHYVYINNIQVKKESPIIYNFYEPLFTSLSGDIQIYNKLYVYIKAKVLEYKSHNGPMFAQREIFGYDEATVIDFFLRTVLISENMVKFRFPEEWNKSQHKFSENIIGFIKTITKYQLMYFVKFMSEKTLTEITNTKNEDGLSDIDKVKMNTRKMDEGIITRAEISISQLMDRLNKEYPNISDDEVEFYKKNHSPNKLQSNLIYQFVAKYLGNARDTNLITWNDYCRILVIMKYKFLTESGYDPNEFNPDGPMFPYILCGDVASKVNNRLIRNTKFLTKVKESALYDSILAGKYSYLEELMPNYILQLLSQIINTTFTFVVYKHPELTGQEIILSEDKISDELLLFINNL